MNANRLVRYLQKPASEFTREDLIRYCAEQDIQMVNLLYPAGDGRLKTLNFVINDQLYLDTILTCGRLVALCLGGGEQQRPLRHPPLPHSLS